MLQVYGGEAFDNRDAEKNYQHRHYLSPSKGLPLKQPAQDTRHHRVDVIVQSD